MDFEKELEFYLDNKEDLIRKHKGKVLVIKDARIVGVYDTVSEAYDFGVKNYGLGNFAIQQVSEDSESPAAFCQSSKVAVVI